MAQKRRQKYKTVSSINKTTIIRRWMNKIECLLNDRDKWVSDKELLKNLPVKYYTNLFIAEVAPEGAAPIEENFPPLRVDQRLELEREYSAEEVWKALLAWDLRKPLDQMSSQLLSSRKHGAQMV